MELGAIALLSGNTPRRCLAEVRAGPKMEAVLRWDFGYRRRSSVSGWICMVSL